jgi:serralysin
LEQGAEFIAGKIALDFVERAVAAAGLRSAVAIGFSAVAYSVASPVAAALVAHELFTLFGVQDGIKNFVDGILGTQAVWVEAFDKQGDLVRGASYGGGLGGLAEIDAVRGLIQRNETGGTIAVDNQIAVERANTSFSSYTLKAANLAEQIATPLLKTAQEVLGWTGAQDQNGQPKHNSDVFIPHFDQFTIVNDQAKIAIEIPLGSATEKLALSVRAIATNGDVSGLREFGTVAVFGSTGADSMQVPGFSTDPGSQKVYAFGGGGGDTIRTGAGNDLIFGDSADINSSATNRQGDGADIIFAGAGNDVVYGGGQADQISGEEGNDKLYGQSGKDQIDGGAGDDQIFGGPGNDTLNGGADNDQIVGGLGKDKIDGGDGDDVLIAGSDIPGEDDMEANTVFGGAGKDQLTGALGDDELGGGDGRDKLVGLAGNDKFFGGRDGDTYTGGPGADEFYVGPQDRVLDSSADDKLFLQYTPVTSTKYLSQFEEFGAFPDHGFRKGYNYYAIGDTDSRGQHLLINTGHSLFVFFADGQVAMLGNYDQGDFGISVPNPTEFLARANQEFSDTWASLHNSHLITEPYTKLLTEALRLEAAMTASPDATLEISASAKEYVAKILQPDDHGPGYDPASEGISTAAPLRALNGFSPQNFAASDGPPGSGSAQSSAPGIVVTGTGDSEFLPGTDGADTIAGGAGTDILYGGLGSDTYVYLKDDGFDSIIDFAGAEDVDTLQLADLNPDDVTVTGDGADLMIHNQSRAAINDNGEAYTTLFVVGQFEGDGSGVEQIQFADGTIWDRDTIASHAIHAPTGADVVFGGSVEENAEAGTFVAQLAGIDPDFDSRFTYSLVDDPSGLFTVTERGSLNVADGAAIDYESATSHDVIVRVTDQTGLSFDKTVTVTVENVGGTFTGTDANDTLNGTIEEDVLIGLAGNDTYTVNNPGDVILENPGEGTDTVKTALAAYTLGGNVENLTGTGTVSQVLTGNDFNNNISGGAGDDTLIGGGGNDSLNGGTGADAMAGGIGNDTYTVDNVGDTVIENPGEGTDLIKTSLAAYTLGDNLENLTGTGTASQALTGNSLDNTISGGAGDDTLSGAGGNDALNGGTGADQMIGGIGDDTFTVDNAGDVVIENAGEGTDTVKTSLVTYTLADNVENLTGTGTAGQTLSGNAAANTVSGGAGDDTLYGGDGNDTLKGGAGNDSLFGEAGNDTLNGGGGNDQLNGGAGDDTITGATENDVIEGGAGNDKLTGAAGNDTFVFRAGFGHDTITDFTAGPGTGDVIEFHDGMFGSFEAVVAASHQAGNNVEIDIDAATSILLKGVTLASLNQNDFAFL